MPHRPARRLLALLCGALLACVSASTARAVELDFGLRLLARYNVQRNALETSLPYSLTERRFLDERFLSPVNDTQFGTFLVGANLDVSLGRGFSLTFSADSGLLRAGHEPVVQLATFFVGGRLARSPVTTTQTELAFRSNGAPISDEALRTLFLREAYATYSSPASSWRGPSVAVSGLARLSQRAACAACGSWAQKLAPRARALYVQAVVCAVQRASAWFAAGALGIAVLIVADARADEAPYSRARAGRVRALAERVAKEVVLVEVVRAAAGSLVKELRFDGGGFHAGQGRIVTSAFLLEKAERVRVQLPDGQWHDAKVTKSKPELGLAVLFVEAAKSMPAPEIARASPVPVLGQAVFLSTRPTSGEPAVTMGFWIDPPGRTYYGRTTLSARNGHPLFDEWGHVCALALLPARPAGGGLVAPSWALRRFLDLPTQTKEELAAEKDPLRDEFPLPTRTVTGKPAVFD